MELDQIKHIWQEQSAPMNLETTTMERINSFQKKVRQQRLGIYVILPITSVAIITVGILFYNPIYMTGILMMVFAMILAIVQYQRIGPVNTPSTPGADTKEFLRKQLDQFKALDKYSLKFIPIYMVLIWLGGVVSYLGMPNGESIEQRISPTIGFAIGIAIAFILIYKRSRKNLFQKYLPLREELESNLSQLEEQEWE